MLQVKNGKNTRFWEDIWLKDKPLCMLHPVLFDWCLNKNISVYNVLCANGRLPFDRWLPPSFFEEWLGILDATFSFNFEDANDKVSWKWGRNKMFTTKSTYDHLTVGQSRGHFNHIWKAKIPYKIKIFTWLLEKDVVLTKDNLIRRNWLGNPSCIFCGQLETSKHLFFQCPVARCIWGMVGSCLGANNVPNSCTQFKLWIERWLPNGKPIHHFGFAAVCWAIWKGRNKAIFDGKIIRHPAEILTHACAFMTYWAGLTKEDFQVGILEGVKSLLAYAHRALAQQAATTPRMLPAPPTPATEDEDEA